tara:strand:- start:33882 stop:34301 length:420 start_codon:yes stop_codon:yes gene_type:complete
MRKVLLLILSPLFFLACTSNTIYEKPKDLIPKDTMTLLIKELFIASASKNIKNKNLQRRISYIPLVYNKYNIDSTRFISSNFYYTTQNHEYKGMLSKILVDLKKEQIAYSKIKKERDSIAKDSIAKITLLQKKEKALKK